MGPFLDGVRVLDMTRLLPGPYATTTLADLGAEVVKVERPGVGDPVRQREPYADDRSYTHLTRNRNKKSVALNLKRECGRAVFLELARSADVVVESFRPGVVDRLGVGYDDVRAVNDDIVYCSISGYGQEGPYADRPGHDLNYIGVAGLLALTGEPDGIPTPPGYPIGDFVSGLYAALAIAAGVAGVRAGTGGDHIDVSMTDTVASFATVYLDRYEGRGEIPRRGETALTGSHPGYRVYEAGDGKLLSVAALEEHFWQHLCDALDTPELERHHIGPNGELADGIRAGVVDTIAEEIRTHPRAEWLDRFDRYDVPAAPVNEYDELFDDPQLTARGAFEELSLPGSDKTFRLAGLPLQFAKERAVESTHAPRLGSHTVSLLSAVGYEADEIARLVDDGVAETDD